MTDITGIKGLLIPLRLTVFRNLVKVEKLDKKRHGLELNASLAGYPSNRTAKMSWNSLQEEHSLLTDS